MLTVTAIYAAAFALLLIYLSIRVISIRRRDQISLGAGGDSTLEKRIRAHANFTEYTPLGLILLAALELNSAPLWQLHIVGGLLLVGRLCHPVGVNGGPMNFRVGGMLMTFLSLLTGAVFILAGRLF